MRITNISVLKQRVRDTGSNKVNARASLTHFAGRVEETYLGIVSEGGGKPPNRSLYLKPVTTTSQLSLVIRVKRDTIPKTKPHTY